MTDDLKSFYQLSPTGIAIAEDISYEQWAQLGEQLHALIDCAYWAVGGWLAFGERKFPERYASAVSPDRTRRVQNHLRVWRAVPPEVRHENLSWSHHREVAAIADIELQRKLLDMAEVNNWPVATLAAAVRRAKETAGEDLMPWQPVEPDTATRLFGSSGRVATQEGGAIGEQRRAEPDLRVVAGTEHAEPSGEDHPYGFFWAVVEAARDAIAKGEITDELKKAVADVDALEAISKRNVG